MFFQDDCQVVAVGKFFSGWWQKTSVPQNLVLGLTAGLPQNESLRESATREEAEKPLFFFFFGLSLGPHMWHMVRIQFSVHFRDIS